MGRWSRRPRHGGPTARASPREPTGVRVKGAEGWGLLPCAVRSWTSSLTSFPEQRHPPGAAQAAVAADGNRGNPEPGLALTPPGIGRGLDQPPCMYTCRTCVRRVRGGFWSPGNWPLQDFQCPVRLDAGVPEMFREPVPGGPGLSADVAGGGPDLGPYRFRIGKAIQDDVQDLLAELRIPSWTHAGAVGRRLPPLWSDVLVRKIAGVDAPFRTPSGSLKSRSLSPWSSMMRGKREGCMRLVS